MDNGSSNRSMARFLLPAFVGVLFCAALSAAEPATQSSGTSSKPANPEALATYRGVGSALVQIVGPGPTPGSERLYLSYTYSTGLEVVSVDVDTGQCTVYPTPVPSETAAHAMEAGADGKIYLGTAPHAHLLCLDPAKGTIVDLGRPLDSEQYIWQLRMGNDRKLYGCTYPSAKFFRFDPVAKTVEDFGRLDPDQKYAHFLAAANEGFVYIGVGPRQPRLFGFRIQTEVLKEIPLTAPGVIGYPNIYKAEDGKCYVTLGGRSYVLNGWIAVPKESIPGGSSRATLRDGSALTVEGDVIARSGKGVNKEVRFRYEGREAELFRLAMGPDRMLYASTVMPSYLLRIDPQTGAMTKLGKLGGGEVYSFLSYKQWLLIASYSNEAPLMVYDPARPWVGKEAAGGKVANPQLVPVKDFDNSWRPVAMAAGPRGKVYVGGVPGYGKLGGPLCIWDPPAKVECQLSVIKDQSVVALAPTGDLLLGGTDVIGGGGSNPTQGEATLFLWDPETKTVVYQTRPVPGATRISGLVAVSKEKAYGVAEKPGGVVLFSFDPAARAVGKRQDVLLNPLVEGGLALSGDGRVWGLARGEIFSIDPATDELQVRTTFDASVGHVRGFALQDGALYYAVGPTVYRYRRSSKQ